MPPIELNCPCCEAKLVVDSATGEILSAERPRVDPTKTFDTALKDVQTGEQRRNEAFHKAFDRTQRLDDLLNKKFEEAKKKAAKEPGKPRNPLDWE
jgi:hypothetical protein